jgi:hypothetical protein
MQAIARGRGLPLAEQLAARQISHYDHETE